MLNLRFICLLLAIGFFASGPIHAEPVASVALPVPLAPLVCLDPGHPSEVSAGDTLQNGLREVDVVWEVAQLMRPHLEKAGIHLVMTRNGPRHLVTNRQRAEIANEAKAGMILRLHCDTGKHSGFAVYYPDRQGKAEGRTGPSEKVIRLSKDAAQIVHQAMIKGITPALHDGGLKGDSQTFIGSKQGALTGSIFSEVPVVLVEMVVLSNASDARFIGTSDGQEAMAQALASGVIMALQTPPAP